MEVRPVPESNDVDPPLESAVAGAAERQRFIAEAAGVGTWVYRVADGSMSWSPLVYEMWGRDPALGPPTIEEWRRLVHPDDVEASVWSREEIGASGGTVETEFRVVHPDGSVRHLVVRARLMLDDAGRPVEYLGVNIDVTGRRTAEAALVELNRSLEERVAAEVAERAKAEEALAQAQKLESIGQLTGGISHDFNNLLGAIVGNLDLLSRKLADERLRRYVDAAMAGAQRGAQLTKQLLAFARKQRLSPQAVDVNSLVDDTARNLLARTLGGMIELDVLPADDLWPAAIDPVQLEAAILNLAVNARDAMPDGGAIAIETSNVRVGPGTHADLEPGDYVLLSVTDTGAGMPPDVVARAVEPFFTTKGTGKGTGLGLSTVYGFLRQSGGTIRITSHPGQGTTVQLYLPRSSTPAASAAAESIEVEHRSKGEIVLVVDDDDGMRETTAELLGELGYAVVSAPSGARALEILGSNPEIRLMVADFAMPGMNGAELVGRARALRPDLRGGDRHRVRAGFGTRPRASDRRGAPQAVQPRRAGRRSSGGAVTSG